MGLDLSIWYDYPVKIVFTKHALEKFAVLESFGWRISKRKVCQTLLKPKWSGKSHFGQRTAMDLLDQSHIIRVIFNKEKDKNDDIIRVVTFHVARRGTYESTK